MFDDIWVADQFSGAQWGEVSLCYSGSSDFAHLLVTNSVQVRYL